MQKRLTILVNANYNHKVKQRLNIILRPIIVLYMIYQQ